MTEIWGLFSTGGQKHNSENVNVRFTACSTDPSAYSLITKTAFYFHCISKHCKDAEVILISHPFIIGMF